MLVYQRVHTFCIDDEVQSSHDRFRRHLPFRTPVPQAQLEILGCFTAIKNATHSTNLWLFVENLSVSALSYSIVYIYILYIYI